MSQFDPSPFKIVTLSNAFNAFDILSSVSESVSGYCLILSPGSDGSGVDGELGSEGGCGGGAAGGLTRDGGCDGSANGRDGCGGGGDGGGADGCCDEDDVL